MTEWAEPLRVREFPPPVYEDSLIIKIEKERKGKIMGTIQTFRQGEGEDWAEFIRRVRRSLSRLPGEGYEIQWDREYSSAYIVYKN